MPQFEIPKESPDVLRIGRSGPLRPAFVFSPATSGSARIDAILDKLTDETNGVAVFGPTVAPKEFVALLRKNPAMTCDEALDSPLPFVVNKIVIERCGSNNPPCERSKFFLELSDKVAVPAALNGNWMAMTKYKDEMARTNPEFQAFIAEHFQPRPVCVTTWRDLFTAAVAYFNTLPLGAYMAEGVEIDAKTATAAIAWGT